MARSSNTGPPFLAQQPFQTAPHPGSVLVVVLRALPTSAEVGGDYYDFLELPKGRLGIAIGDVSGKGIGAALLMASLEASLRGQVSVGHDLAELMKRINTLVYEASSANRYATLFYAEYDPQSRQLSYVNAGHNPPVILRKSAAALPDLPLNDRRSGDRAPTGGLLSVRLLSS